MNTSRYKKALNAYIKNHATLSALASLIANKDCSQLDLVNASEFSQSAVALLPMISDENDGAEFNSAVSKYFISETAGRIVFILCGYSASGKDTLASYVNHLLYMQCKEFTYTKKYTTRAQRGNEGANQAGSRAEPSGNYEYFDRVSEFPADSSLNYSLYGHYYALSGDDLKSTLIEDKYQMCIYGKLENIHEVRQKLFLEHKRLPFTILINSKADNCEGRIIRRHSMTDEEQIIRVKEMKRQAEFLSKNTVFVETAFDLVIDNSDTHAVDNSSRKLADFISEKMIWAQKTAESGYRNH